MRKSRLVLLLVLSGAMSVVQGDCDARVQFHADTNSLSINVKDAPLVATLLCVHLKTGIEVNIATRATGGRITAQFNDRDLQAAIPLLLQEFNTVIRYDDNLLPIEIDVLPAAEDAPVAEGPQSSLTRHNDSNPEDDIHLVRLGRLPESIKIALSNATPEANATRTETVHRHRHDAYRQLLDIAETKIGENATTRELRKRLNEGTLEFPNHRRSDHDDQELR